MLSVSGVQSTSFRRACCWHPRSWAQHGPTHGSRRRYEQHGCSEAIKSASNPRSTRSDHAPTTSPARWGGIMMPKEVPQLQARPSPTLMNGANACTACARRAPCSPRRSHANNLLERRQVNISRIPLPLQRPTATPFEPSAPKKLDSALAQVSRLDHPSRVAPGPGICQARSNKSTAKSTESSDAWEASLRPTRAARRRGARPPPTFRSRLAHRGGCIAGIDQAARPLAKPARGSSVRARSAANHPPAGPAAGPDPAGPGSSVQPPAQPGL
jgi:hypothetical protein